MLEQFTAFSPAVLALQVAGLAAGLVVLKQWIRADIRKLQHDITQQALKSESHRKETDHEMEKLDMKFTEALSRLAATVETYVRSSTEERFRASEAHAEREKQTELKVAKLEVTVGNMNVTLNRVADQVNALVLRSSPVSDA